MYKSQRHLNKRFKKIIVRHKMLVSTGVYVRAIVCVCVCVGGSNLIKEREREREKVRERERER